MDARGFIGELGGWADTITDLYEDYETLQKIAPGIFGKYHDPSQAVVKAIFAAIARAEADILAAIAASQIQVEVANIAAAAEFFSSDVVGKTLACKCSHLSRQSPYP